MQHSASSWYVLLILFFLFQFLNVDNAMNLQSTPKPNIFPKDMECSVYQLAFEYANKIQELTSKQADAIYDALQLDLCKNASILKRKFQKRWLKQQKNLLQQNKIIDNTSIKYYAFEIYISVENGHDETGDGSFSNPFRTITAGQAKLRKIRQNTPPQSLKRAIIYLRQGIYYLNETLMITEKDSNLTIQNYKGEKVEISGATPLQNLKWKVHDLSNNKNIWVTELHKKTLLNGVMTGLRYDGKRGIRARWPNGDPETQLFPDGWSQTIPKWLPPKTFKSIPKATNITVETPNRSAEGPCQSINGYCHYVTGVGGKCLAYGFSPPSGYWCNSDPPRGKEYSTSFPSGFVYDKNDFNGRIWNSFQANTSIVNAFRDGHWFSYVFLIDEYDPEKRLIKFGKGGFQGGEGATTAAEWNVENVFEELDSPNEWYYDENAEKLYWYYNSTKSGTPPNENLRVEATQLQELIIIRATEGESDGNMVTNVNIDGIKFTGAALSYLEPHGLPSDGGGDWALARSAAIILEKTSNVSIENCLFERLDGNAILISGYNRHATIKKNEFHWIGENGVLSWGYTSDFPQHKVTPRKVPIPKGQGPDATDGNHPQYTLLDSNFFHEIGHFQKQVSCYFQAQTQLSTHRNNICFNGPRAGWNFNDGMGGGNTLTSNLIFNMVRETADHGTFNSWDRQPFLYKNEETGEKTYVPRMNEIKYNFWMNNYNPQEATDNDDGSCYYNTHHNFFPFSVGGLKSDFGGHDNHHHHNVYLNGGTTTWGSINCMSVCGQYKGHEDQFYNNTCILINGTNYATFHESEFEENIFPIMHDNHVFTNNGIANETGSAGVGYPVEQWQKRGHDLGTTVGLIPTNEKIIEMAKEALGWV